MRRHAAAAAALLLALALAASPASASNAAPASALAAAQAADVTYDVLVYGATPAGFAAALAARAAGASRVLLVEPTSYVGGMASPGGIGLRDCDMDAVRDNNSTQHQWGMRNARHYFGDAAKSPVWQPDNWVGQASFRGMIDDAGVDLWLNAPVVEGSAGVRVDEGPPRRLTAVAFENATSPRAHGGGGIGTPGAPRWVAASYVVDASYEGEVLMAAGVTYTYGRESNATYNESYGGVTATSLNGFNPDISPFVDAARADADADPDTEGARARNGEAPALLKYIQDGPDPRTRVGQSDKNVMAFSYRACLTPNATLKVPITPPDGYDPADFELPRRYLLAQVAAKDKPSTPWGDLSYHGYPYTPTKIDACCGMAAVGIDAPGLAVEYATATRAQRAVIAAAHRYYVQGLMWFWVNDSAVPDDLRRQHQEMGLCGDEWPENGHFPPQLYVREAVRMVGDRVYSQNDRVPYDATGGCRDDSVAIGSWALDIHQMQRVAVQASATGATPSAGMVAFNEGLTSPGLDGAFPFELPFWLLLPKRADLTNLMAPNCPSISHVAFAAIREEPTLWQLGQAAGTAAAVALRGGGPVVQSHNTAARAPRVADVRSSGGGDGGGGGNRGGGGFVALQDLNVFDVQAALLAQHTFVHWPPRANCSSPSSGPMPACDATQPNITSITVSGAGLAAANGVYTRQGNSSDTCPVFLKDATHQLYRYGGAWEIAEFGVTKWYTSQGTRLDGPPLPNATMQVWAWAGPGVAQAPPTGIECDA